MRSREKRRPQIKAAKRSPKASKSSSSKRVKKKEAITEARAIWIGCLGDAVKSGEDDPFVLTFSQLFNARLFQKRYDAKYKRSKFASDRIPR